MGVKTEQEVCEGMVSRILKMRTALRYERDQLGDNRCWLDLGLIFAAAGMRPDLVKLPQRERMQKLCRFFHQNTQRPGDPQPLRPDAITDPAHWDDDLVAHAHDRDYLETQEYVLVAAIRRLYHRNRRTRGYQVTYADYDRVYMTLPEKLHADTRLPPVEEFLGEAKAPHAGCPAFWASHQRCDPGKDCNVHVWGHECPARQ